MNTPGSKNKASKIALLWAAPLLFLVAFYFYPLGSILDLSLGRSQGGIGAAFAQLFTSPRLRGVLAFTFGQAALSTLLTLLVGLPGAYVLARYRFPGKSLVQALASVPFVMPTLVVAAGFNAFLGPRGWLNTALMDWLGLHTPPIQFVNTLWAILVAHVFYNTTIVLRSVGDFWSHLDPRLEQAARVLGASRWRALKEVTFPLLLPSIASAALLVFIFDFTSFGVILILGGPRFSTLEVEIYNQTIGLFNLPLAAALSMVQLACTLALALIHSRLATRASRPLPMRPSRVAQRSLVTWRGRLLALIVLGGLLLLLVLPLASLALRSFLAAGPGSAPLDEAVLTLDYYRELWMNRRGSLFFVPPVASIAVSLGYAGITVILALVLGLPAAWALASGASSLNRILEPLLMLPLGTSAVTLGLGFIVALDRPPLDLRASPLLIPLAHTLVAFPFVVRSLVPALRSIRPRLRQAAAVLGASPSQVVRKVDLPLVGRAVLVAAVFAFTISIGEFGATALLARPEYPTIPVVIFRYLSQPGALNYGQALALSTILMVVTATGMVAIERLRIADLGEF